jgi:site-specific DNA recombinase
LVGVRRAGPAVHAALDARGEVDRLSDPARLYKAAQVRELRADLRHLPGIALGEPSRGMRACCPGEHHKACQVIQQRPAQLWMPETGGRVDYASEHDEKTMTVLGLSSKREIIRTSIRVRTAMAVRTREQGRYLGGRPPYGYRLADAGPHPNKAHAAWGRRAHRLDPDPATAPTVRWIFAQRLAGHSVARIARALNEAGVPCPSAADPGRNTHRTGEFMCPRPESNQLRIHSR